MVTRSYVPLNWKNMLRMHSKVQMIFETGGKLSIYKVYTKYG